MGGTSYSMNLGCQTGSRVGKVLQGYVGWGHGGGAGLGPTPFDLGVVEPVTQLGGCEPS